MVFLAPLLLTKGVNHKGLGASGVRGRATLRIVRAMKRGGRVGPGRVGRILDNFVSKQRGT